MKASINYLSTQESSGSYYPEVAGNPKVSIELASDGQLVKNRARPPLLTVPTRRAKAEKLSRKVKGESVKRKEVKSLQGVVRESLSKHAEKRAEAAAAKMEDNADINILAIGEEEVDKVKELGIDRAKKVNKGDGKGQSSFGDMLKTGLNTLNTIQTMSKVLGGGGAGGGGSDGGGKNTVMDLVGSLLTGGEGRKGTKSKKGVKAKSPLDPLVDSAFDLFGGEEATGGLRRFAKPFLKNLIQSNY